MPAIYGHCPQLVPSKFCQKISPLVIIGKVWEDITESQRENTCQVLLILPGIMWHVCSTYLFHSGCWSSISVYKRILSLGTLGIQSQPYHHGQWDMVTNHEDDLANASLDYQYLVCEHQVDLSRTSHHGRRGYLSIAKSQIFLIDGKLHKLLLYPLVTF